MKEQKASHTLSPSDNTTFEKYLNEIGKEKKLSQEEEAELSLRIKQGDKDALEKLTRCNLRFVVSVAKHFQRQGLSLQDLISEGNFGLIKAAKNFDANKGVRFSAYAFQSIRQSILQAIAEQGHLTKLSQRKSKSVGKLNASINKFVIDNERRPSVDEMSEATSLPSNEIAEIAKATKKHVSIDAPLNDKSGESMADFLSGSDIPETDSQLIRQKLQQDIKNSLDTLNDRERAIVEAFYGIDQEEMTLAEIGEKYNLKRERVRQIRKKAIRKIHKNSNSKLLKLYL